MWNKIFFFEEDWAKWRKNRGKLSLRLLLLFLLAAFNSYVLAQTLPPESTQAAESKHPVESAESYNFLDLAIAQVRGCRGIDATFTLQCSLFGKKLVGHGAYQEKKDPYDESVASLRYEMSCQMGELSYRSIVIIDPFNRRLWMSDRFYALSEELSEPSTAFYADLNRLAEAYEVEPGLYSAIKPPWFGQKSLENTLVDLWEHFDFLPPEEIVVPLGSYYLLHGKLKDAARRTIYKDRPAALMPEIPDGVTICLDKETFFPFQFIYWKEEKKGENSVDRREILSQTFDNFTPNSNFDPQIFQYQPSIPPADVTDDFLKRVAVRRKATEESQNDGTTK
ncbi:MAG: hypothetical protein Q4D38_06210 [Planctomycetia bacterium]|nr:hypothetical protein [Planctomycetia bacterium]